MLSTGIKNSILIILIIFIFHFIIKNVLLNKNEHFSNIVCKNEELLSEKDNTPIKTTMPELKELPSEKIQPPSVTCNLEKEGMARNDVFDAWFADELKKASTDAELDKFFLDNKDISEEIEKATKCPLPVKDKGLPATSTCDINFDNLPIDIVKKEIKCDTPDRYMKHGMMLKEYQNENIMNGGKLFMDLHAYNSIDDTYASL